MDGELYLLRYIRVEEVAVCCLEFQVGQLYGASAWHSHGPIFLYGLSSVFYRDDFPGCVRCRTGSFLLAFRTKNTDSLTVLYWRQGRGV